MPRPLFSLLVLVPILMVDAILEMSLVSAMVGFLHGRSRKPWDIISPDGSTFEMKGHPHVLLENQGHTSNGAGGTAFILIGFGGLLAIWLQKRQIRTAGPSEMKSVCNANMLQTGSTKPSAIFTLWVVLSILSVLLTLGALIYTFILTSDYAGQTIDQALLAANPYPHKYPADKWTPENWFSAMLHQLQFVHDSDKSTLRTQVDIQRGWRYNLIPLFIIGLATACAAVYEWLSLRRQGTKVRKFSKERVGESF